MRTTDFSDDELAQFAPTDAQLRQFADRELQVQAAADVIDGSPLPVHTHCDKCGAFCPSGTLDNGLCSDCDLVGKKVLVYWGRFGLSRCLVDHVSKNGIVYACRWNVKQHAWTAPRALEYRRQCYYLRGR